jgi:hypothetical protein
MPLTIDLPPETEKKLRERAAEVGQDVSTFVREAVEEKLRAVLLTWEEICAPLAEAVQASGMTDDEVRDFFTAVRDEVRAEKRARRGQQDATA